jgi:molecular chaperone DnaK (HSP70)
MAESIVGIDLGTTNSEIAAFIDGKVQVIGTAGEQIMPSVVGLAPDGTLLVGTPARNQVALYPERTVKSIKRLMGSDQRVTLGDRTYTPPEISALILRTLKTRAEAVLRTEVRKAVITVPAYFSDAQRQATRDAGQIAGLDVVRILNEPTAAALAYGEDRQGARTLLVYDLGGGTFDVSVVHVQGDITEVLASHGNNRLGGDDFDQLLLDFVHERFVKSGGVNVRNDRHAMSRLLHAVEEAKKRLSFEPYTRIREEHLTERDGVPLHLDVEVARTEYEHLIRSLLDGTLDSVHRALTDAGKRPDEIDEILLVGGATRTLLVSKLLEEKTGLTPRQELHPDLCVAFGAGVLAARMSGYDIKRVLVDISPYSFGPSHFGVLNGMPTEHCYRPIIVRNTPLPVSRTESYMTMVDNQDSCEVCVYQGDDPYALNNILVGRFMVEGLSKVPAGNEILCRVDLDLDGILRVTATEKRTGLAKHITIEGATTAMSAAEVAAARHRMHELFPEEDLGEIEDGSEELDELDEEQIIEAASPTPTPEERDRDRRVQISEARALLERSRRLFDAMNSDDREEAIGLHEQIEQALQRSDWHQLQSTMTELADLLFYVEER